MRSIFLALGAAAIALAAGAPAASALGPVDQSQPAADGSITMPPGIAQTFTVGRDGRLDGITLSAPASEVVSYQFYDLQADGTPDVSRPRLAQNGTATLVGGVQSDIGFPGIAVKAGDRLAFAAGSARSTVSASLATGSGDPYLAGDLFTVGGYWTFTPVAADLQFSTHVTAPAPTQLALATLRSSGGRPTAVLTSGSAMAPVAGRTVSFVLLRSNGAVRDSCSAVTSSTGTATCAKKWSIAGGSMTAEFAGDIDYQASSATVTG